MFGFVRVNAKYDIEEKQMMGVLNKGFLLLSINLQTLALSYDF
jgi:hypothetical protein